MKQTVGAVLATVLLISCSSGDGGEETNATTTGQVTPESGTPAETAPTEEDKGSVPTTDPSEASLYCCTLSEFCLTCGCDTAETQIIEAQLESACKQALDSKDYRCTTSDETTALAKCASAATGSTDAPLGGASAFAGDWKYVSGTITATCDGQNSNGTLSGNVTLRQTDVSRLTLVDDDCPVHFNVEGPLAVLDGEYSCSNDSGDTVRVTEFKLTLADYDSLDLMSRGVATIDSGGATVTCQMSWNGDLERL